MTKVIYLPDPKYQELAVSGVETLVSTRLEPGVDPILEADKRGTILLIVRLGAIDLEMPSSPVAGAVVDGPVVGAPINGGVIGAPINGTPMGTVAPVTEIPPGNLPPGMTPPPPAPAATNRLTWNRRPPPVAPSTPRPQPSPGASRSRRHGTAGRQARQLASQAERGPGGSAGTGGQPGPCRRAQELRPLTRRMARTGPNPQAELGRAFSLMTHEHPGGTAHATCSAGVLCSSRARRSVRQGDPGMQSEAGYQTGQDDVRQEGLTPPGLGMQDQR